MFMVILMTLTACKNEKSTAAASDEVIGTCQLKYATQFSIDYFEDGYKCIHVADGCDYILVPKDKENRNFGMNNAVFIPVDSESIYVAASSAMDLFATLGCLDMVTACSTKAEDFSINEVKEKIEAGDISYVGKYSAPDYERLLSLNCDYAIESTMIGHAPKIKEQLESLMIPVFVERSSYEENPLGRVEWIKVYGALTGQESQAEAFFDSQVEKLEKMTSQLEIESTDNRKKVAFFYISSSGYVNVRKPGDYICKMIDIAGGEYALNDIMPESNALSTVNINWEEFYALAKEADILIYNSTIDGGFSTVDELIEKNQLFKDFKAVKEGRVYCTSMNMYQESSSIVDVILDFNNVIFDKKESDNRFIIPLK